MNRAFNFSVKIRPLALAVSLVFFSHESVAISPVLPMAPLLAIPYENERILDWERYIFSEKLDGIRAIWTGTELRTKQGTRLFAPEEFIERLPDYPVEGELWAGRGTFEYLMSVVLDKTPNTQEWKKVQFMLFDLPAHQGDYSARYRALREGIKEIGQTQIQIIEHLPAKNEKAIMKELERRVRLGAEGLILRDKKALYVSGRDEGVQKLKVTQDAEAQVVRYFEGKGKYKGKMGSMLVKMDNGKTFKIGTGFTDEQRMDPPKIGSKVTYLFNGLTKKGIPKFARYWRTDMTKQ